MYNSLNTIKGKMMKSIFESKMRGMSEASCLITEDVEYINRYLSPDNFSTKEKVTLVKKYAIKEGINLPAISDMELSYIIEAEGNVINTESGGRGGGWLGKLVNGIGTRFSNFKNGYTAARDQYKAQRRNANMEARRQRMEMRRNINNAYRSNPNQFRSNYQNQEDAATMNGMMDASFDKDDSTQEYNTAMSDFNNFYGVGNRGMVNGGQQQIGQQQIGQQQEVGGDPQAANTASQSVDSVSSEAETPETKQQIRQIAKIIKDTGEKSTKRDLISMQKGLKNAYDSVSTFIKQRDEKLAQQRANRLTRASKTLSSGKTGNRKATVNQTGRRTTAPNTTKSSRTRRTSGNRRTTATSSQPMHDYSQGADVNKMREVTGDIVQNSFDYRQMLKNRMPLRESFARRVPLRHNLAHSYFERRMGL